MLKLNVEGRAGLIRLVSSVFEAPSPVPMEDSALLALADRPCDLPAQLTEAERDVARQVYEGLSNEDIAARRETSSRTVANQLRAIYTKLGLNSREELVRRLGGGDLS
ncbi:helix-turn-helix transcriptional regulator [Lujinxingia vulgaris]|uniref:Helix-turn-helix transcriptional regulator n=2 Tax=Lujinxingia vulgaris TaxID=2600176 RepID=A0A5C6X9A7_9DELT|nr:helix-turn-helix transcriptional regulator [Lujinxingia vulgaris]